MANADTGEEFWDEESLALLDQVEASQQQVESIAAAGQSQVKTSQSEKSYEYLLGETANLRKQLTMITKEKSELIQQVVQIKQESLQRETAEVQKLSTELKQLQSKLLFQNEELSELKRKIRQQPQPSSQTTSATADASEPVVSQHPIVQQNPVKRPQKRKSAPIGGDGFFEMKKPMKRTASAIQTVVVKRIKSEANTKPKTCEVKSVQTSSDMLLTTLNLDHVPINHDDQLSPSKALFYLQYLRRQAQHLPMFSSFVSEGIAMKVISLLHSQNTSGEKISDLAKLLESSPESPPSMSLTSNFQVSLGLLEFDVLVAIHFYSCLHGYSHFKDANQTTHERHSLYVATVTPEFDMSAYTSLQLNYSTIKFIAPFLSRIVVENASELPPQLLFSLLSVTVVVLDLALLCLRSISSSTTHQPLKSTIVSSVNRLIMSTFSIHEALPGSLDKKRDVAKCLLQCVLVLSELQEATQAKLQHWLLILVQQCLSRSEAMFKSEVVAALLHLSIHHAQIFVSTASHTCLASSLADMITDKVQEFFTSSEHDFLQNVPFLHRLSYIIFDLPWQNQICKDAASKFWDSFQMMCFSLHKLEDYLPKLPSSGFQDDLEEFASLFDAI